MPVTLRQICKGAFDELHALGIGRSDIGWKIGNHDLPSNRLQRVP
jgi:hypothetical protein